jgi:hypothetical protein
LADPVCWQKQGELHRAAHPVATQTTS